jgi:hypothetical protein
MVKDSRAYRELCEKERWEALARMSIADTIAIGEALLTSEIMNMAAFPDDDHPMSLARALGIGSQHDQHDAARE